MDKKKEIHTGIRFFVEQECDGLRQFRTGYKWIGFNGGFAFQDDEWKEILDVINLYLETEFQIIYLSKKTVQIRVANTIINTFDEWRANPSKKKTFIDYTNALSKKIGRIIENNDDKILLDNIFVNYDKVDEEEKKNLEAVLVKAFGFHV